MKQTTQSICGTSFHDTIITTTLNKLKKVLGEPVCFDNTGEDKVNIEWKLETENGKVFTVYDWKEYRPIKPNELIEWHIGGFTPQDTKEAYNEIMDGLNKL